MHSRPANIESPRWYIKERRYVEAYTSLRRLRLHEIQAARDLYYITAQIGVEAELIGNTNHVRRFGELFTITPYSESYLGVVSGYDRTTNVRYKDHRKCSYRGFKSASQHPLIIWIKSLAGQALSAHAWRPLPRYSVHQA
jgi:hypothetical protein